MVITNSIKCPLAETFGLKTALANFQRLMDLTLTSFIGTELLVYLDDIVIYANTLKEHEIIFNNLAARRVKANHSVRLVRIFLNTQIYPKS